MTVSTSREFKQDRLSMVPDRVAKERLPNTGYSGRRSAAAEPEDYAIRTNFYMIVMDDQRDSCID